MIIDFIQQKDGIQLSYVNKYNNIEVVKTPYIQYFNFVECDEFDPNRLQNLISFKGSFIKKDISTKFSHHNINEFFNNGINDFPELRDDLNLLKIPNLFSVDIETEITDEYGYSSPEEAQNKILTLSITDDNLNSILFILRNENCPNIDAEERNQIRAVLDNSLGDYSQKYEYNFNIRIFDSEIEMLKCFLECVNKYFHSIMGWNFVLFDWLWIFNRCKRLGIDVAKASPVHKLMKKTFKLNKKESVQIEMPLHRIINDYMQFFKDSLIYNNLGSYSLNNISELILGLQKVDYEGNLRTLYNENFPKFLGYALMDTILVMLIHKKVNLYTINFFQSFYTKVPYLKLSQNSISEALVYQTLKRKNIFLLQSEKNVPNTRPYAGGFVKKPTKKIVKSVAAVDAKSLYPNVIRTMGISPELIIDKIKLDDTPLKRPLNDVENQKWLKYKAMNYGLSATGVVYDMNVEGLYFELETQLLNERKIFKGHASDIYLKILSEFENRLREINPNNKILNKK